MKTDVAITARQREVLDTIERLTAQNTMRPTFREVMEPLGIRSTNGIAVHLKALRTKGLVTWDEKLSRTLRIVQQPSSRGMPLVTLEELSA